MFKPQFSKIVSNQGNGMPGQITPQDKIVQVANRMGNPNAGYSQGTTFQIYDSILLNGQTELNFFEDANSKAFPLTNLNAQGGKLGVGETMTILRGQLLFVTYTNDVAPLGPVTAITDMTSSLQFQQGEFSITQGNSVVLKRMKMQTWTDQYNKNAPFAGYNVFHFDTFISVQPLLEFIAQVRLPTAVTVENTFAQLILEGVGGIFSAKGNF